MAATQFAVVYGAASNIIIRIVDTTGDPDDSAIIRVQGNLRPGEAIKIFNLTDFPVRNARTMQAQIGVPTSSGRCAHVVNGKVVNIIMADPAVYTPPTGQLVQSDVAGSGWDWDGTTLTVKVATVSALGIVLSVVSSPNPSALPALASGEYYVVGGAAETAVVGLSIGAVVV